MIYDEKSVRTAVFVDDNSNSIKMKRIPFMSGGYDEAWLQDLITNSPYILPASSISSDYAPLVCIGREVPVGNGETKGFIDNLFISPSGHIVIVETKLFRNQEARRSVVAQIIDYAKELQQWDAETLNKVAAEYFFKSEGQAANIIDILARYGYLSISDEASLVDSINRNLENASFLLMIVGDGIRTGVVKLAEFLNEYTSMQFNLALVELETYRHNDGIIVIPNLITKTTVIERNTIASPRYSFDTASVPNDNRHYLQKPVLSRREFINRFSDNGGYDPDEVTELICDLEAIDGLSVGISPTELTIRYSPEDEYSYALLTFSIASDRSDLWIMPGRIQASLEKHGIFTFEADEFLECYKQYVNVKRCKAPPYEYLAGFYYANVSDVLQNPRDLISAAEQFIINITNK